MNHITLLIKIIPYKLFFMSNLSTTIKEQGTALAENIANVICFVPLGTAVKAIYATAKSYKDKLLIKKIEKFLQGVGYDTNQTQEVTHFYDSLSQQEQEKVAQYLIGFIDAAEHEEKTLLMGYIFKSAVKKEIDHSTMLRLCNIVKLAFINDLKALPKYLDQTQDYDDTVNYLINYGLIDNELGGA